MRGVVAKSNFPAKTEFCLRADPPAPVHREQGRGSTHRKAYGWGNNVTMYPKSISGITAQFTIDTLTRVVSVILHKNPCL